MNIREKPEHRESDYEHQVSDLCVFVWGHDYIIANITSVCLQGILLKE